MVYEQPLKVQALVELSSTAAAVPLIPRGAMPACSNHGGALQAGIFPQA